ncbi:tetratricopeptide repeat-containing sulfotransferase family protein [Oceanobacter sp. 3_MG-2023]|uniref:tetratricopeptide repeat-containing sulfotransferase family protein n=1 Tax=Oceanobacter sp. 3_MG-2023 TaxID=3062622 RepID=UPI002736E450|nr:tetratricopeptide repeat-containing sulfotransferase family protein [Oceanobacter sp. 3_MG-2023]MDP2506278.1 sulfotransferase [Oceanobacter sp. 3_MG-2023]
MVKKTATKNSKTGKANKAALKPVSIQLPGQGQRTLPAQEAMGLAQRWSSSGQPLPALDLLKQVTQQLPGFADAWMLLFATLNKTGDQQGLIHEAQRCLSSKPRFIPALTNLSQAMRLTQQHQSALQLIDKAIKLEPALAELHNHRGVILKETGRSDDALASFNRCLALQPGNANAIWNRSDMIGVLPEQEYQGYAALASGDKLSPRQRVMVYYALSRSDEAAQEYARQFDNIKAGADLYRSLVPYQHQAELNQIEKTISAFPASHPARSSPSADPASDVIPVFICGLPRSGTTLTEHILSSHPSVTAGDELNDLPLACGQYLTRRGIRKSFPDWVADMPQEGWQAIGSVYRKSTRALQGSGWFTDKNLQNYKAIGVIRQALPEARIVVCRRHPMDNLWGCYRQFFSEGMYFTYQQEELADIWNASDKLIQHWQNTGADIFVMEYEALIAEPEPTIRALLDFVGLPWDDACLNFHNNKRSVRTLSATQVRQPLSNSRVAQWRRYEEQLQPMLQRLNQP